MKERLTFICAKQCLINGNHLNTGVGMRHNLITNLQLLQYYLEATMVSSDAICRNKCYQVSFAAT
jgi:hypothetical protein